MLTFDRESSFGSVSVIILDDFEREVVSETVQLQLSFVEEEMNSNILLLPNQAVITIVDSDGVSLNKVTLNTSTVYHCVQRLKLGFPPYARLFAKEMAVPVSTSAFFKGHLETRTSLSLSPQPMGVLRVCIIQ